MDILFYLAAGVSIALAFRAPVNLSEIRNSAVWVPFLLFTSVACWLVWSGLFFSARIYNHLGFPFLYSTGPLLFWYFFHIMKDELVFKPGNFIHFIPAVLAAILSVYSDYYSVSTFTNLLRLGSAISLNLYILAIIYRYSFLFSRQYSSQEKYLYSGVILAASELAAFLSLLATLLQRPEILLTSISIVSLNIFFVYFVGMKFPDLLDNLIREEIIQKYNKSTLENLDVKKLDRNLLNLLQKEKVFCDEDLSLASLSSELKVTPHQLSEFINVHKGKNFNTFINEFRIQEACNLLRESPERSSLSVAMASGFNSVSVFHAVFKKNTGMSPGNFAKNIPK